MKKIFLYTADEGKKSVIGSIAEDQGMDINMIKGSDVNRTIAAICGVGMKDRNEHKKAPMMYMLPEVMLFYGTDDKGLDDFLEAYNAAGIRPIQRKAVVTPTNLGWTLYELAEELGKESGIG